MRNDNTRDQLEDLISLWDEMSKDIETEKKPSQPRTSFYSNLPTEDDYQPNVLSDSDMQLWTELYYRSNNLDFSSINESEKDRNDTQEAGDDPRDGFAHEVGSDDRATYYDKPQNLSAIGPDAGKEYGPVRITRNWNQGKELEELNDLKQKLEYLERVFLRADTREQPTAELAKELESLRKRASDLSEKMQSQPSTDVT